MARKKKGPQAVTAFPEVPQVSFDLKVQDNFVTSHAVEFVHFSALPSPIGLKDKGGYRRSDQYDDESTNGFLYKKVGCFSAVMMSNSRQKADLDGGQMDPSVCRITLPRFYNIDENNESAGKRIYLAPGDRIYVKNPKVDTNVVNYQLMEYDQDRDNVAQFPIKCIESVVDNRNISYNEGVDFIVTREGNIRWINPTKNPGMDVDTGKGRVYAIRYIYEAHWYVVSLPNEVRIGRVTEGDSREETRFPYQAQLVREYVYHNRKNSDKPNQKQEKDERPSREVPEPSNTLHKKPKIKIEMSDIEEGDE